MDKYRTCCVIDDDEFFAFNAKRLMYTAHFCENVLHYENGQQAIDALIGLMVEGFPLPEVILLDINMPKKNGWQFLEEFHALPKANTANTKIYIISSFISPANMTKAAAYDDIVEDYLVKPLEERTLKKILSLKKPA